MIDFQKQLKIRSFLKIPSWKNSYIVIGVPTLFKLISKAAQIKLGLTSLPLVVSWSLTHRCNLKCRYCGRWDMKYDELSIDEVFSVIDELKRLGTKVISFGGGEPLLRDDLEKIIKYCVKNGIEAGLISNGYLIPEKIDEIKHVSVVKLSLDGTEKTHELLRGQGSYQKVIEAAGMLKDNNIKTVFNTTLSKYNLDDIDFLIEKSRELDIPIKFQPINKIVAGSVDINDVIPEPESYRAAIDKIIHLKKKSKYIVNSVQSLQYLRNWPNPASIKCYASKIICHIMPNGDMYPCTMLEGKVKAKNCIKDGVKQAFDNLPDACCSECWCTSTLELNQLLSLKSNPIAAFLQLVLP